MRQRLQFGGLLIALGLSAAMALPCAGQKPRTNAPAQNRGANKPANVKAPNQANHPNRPPQNLGSPNRANTNPRLPTNANRSQNAGGEAGQRPYFNANRPPNATNPQASSKLYRDLSPAEKRSYDQYRRLPPQKQQQMQDAARAWGKLTSQQQNHIKNDVLPAWKQLAPARRNAIQSRLNVLQNMPESARNQHLNDPNFTRGMSEEDKTMLRDLGHMHVGAPDPPGE